MTPHMTKHIIEAGGIPRHVPVQKADQDNPNGGAPAVCGSDWQTIPVNVNSKTEQQPSMASGIVHMHRHAIDGCLFI